MITHCVKLPESIPALSSGCATRVIVGTPMVAGADFLQAVSNPPKTSSEAKQRRKKL